jgi:His-Xaa-Ser system radical SAM maturase HxsB
MRENLKEWAILPYNVSKIKQHYLLTTAWGGWTVLDEESFKLVNRMSFDSNPELFKKLKKNRILLDKDNLDFLVNDFRQLHSNLFYDTGLHIAVVTDNCNFDCLYCQTKKKPVNTFMDLRVATRVLGYLFASSNPCARLEFQGGEPLLNWETVAFLIRFSRKQNKIEKKNLAISLVTNMSLLDKEKINFLIKHDVEICTSFDGPEELHDQNRVFKNGAGTYKAVATNIKRLQEEYKKRKINKKIGVLPTITKQSLNFAKAIIDEYVKFGFDSIHLRPTNRLGQAEKNWDRIGYSAEEFNCFWKGSLDYILDLNKKGLDIKEMMAAYMLRKILQKKDPFYVDLESPCGAARSQLAYAPNGDVYTCDEARMIGSDTFKLGNVLRDKYQDAMKHQNLFYANEASLLNLWDYNSAFCSWSGTCPVMNFYQQNNPVVKITQTPKHKIHSFQFNYLFEKIIYDKDAYKIFRNWVK